MKEWRLCFKYLGCHFVRECRSSVSCEECDGPHPTVMHEEKNLVGQPDKSPRQTLHTTARGNRGTTDDPQNCSKTVLVDLCMAGSPERKLRVYAILDDQSNTSLIDERVLDYFGKKFPKTQYTLRFASQNVQVEETGYLVSGLRASPALGGPSIELPDLLSLSLIHI